MAGSRFDWCGRRPGGEIETLAADATQVGTTRFPENPHAVKRP